MSANELKSQKHFIFWCDNCGAQNKNWIFISALWLISQCYVQIESIQLKYFEKGHTFMRPDSAHGKMGKKFLKWGQLTIGMSS